MEMRAARRQRLLTVIAVTGLSAIAQGVQTGSRPLQLAFYESDTFGSNPRLHVFPVDAKEFRIPLPLTLQWVAYSRSGRSLYATAVDYKRNGIEIHQTFLGLRKIEFNPTRVSVLPGSEGFSYIRRFAVSHSEDILLISGMHTQDDHKTCGIFELSLQTGTLRAVQTSDCRAGLLPQVLDLSPNGKEALTLVNKRLALLDLVDGTAKPLGKEFLGGAWSPDGKWIGALELAQGQSKTVLLDPKDFSRRRDLGGTNDHEVVWSPDSSFILHSVYRPACPSQNAAALETLNIQTGKRSIIKDSICNAGDPRSAGWIDGGIRR